MHSPHIRNGHLFELYLALYGIEHRRTKVRPHPQKQAREYDETCWYIDALSNGEYT